MDEPLSRSPPFNNQQEQECEQHIIAMMWLVNGIIIDHGRLRTVIKEEDLHAFHGCRAFYGRIVVNHHPNIVTTP
jgi:hypothetical protein